MKMFLIVSGAILFSFGVLAVGCVALLGAGATQADKAIKKEEAKGITPAQFQAVPNRMRRTTIEKRLGKPESVDETNIDGQQLDCITYQRKGDIGSMYLFCFSDGRLTSKSSV